MSFRHSTAQFHMKVKRLRSCNLDETAVTLLVMWSAEYGKLIHFLKEQQMSCFVIIIIIIINIIIIIIITVIIIIVIILLHEEFLQLIGLEQWYFSLISNTYMWKLHTYCEQ